MTGAPIWFSSHLDAPRTVSGRCLMDDADIAATVKDAISCVTTVPEGTVEVCVQNGWVTLRGTLGDWAQRECIEHLILHSFGVRGIVNSTTVEEKTRPDYENP